MTKQIELGDKVKDAVTGFEGIAVARVEYLNGCVQFCVKPPVKTDKKTDYPDGQYIDVGQLCVTKKAAVVVKAVDIGPGGDMADTPSDRMGGL